jgi:hypothetical protein
MSEPVTNVNMRLRSCSTFIANSFPIHIYQKERIATKNRLYKRALMLCVFFVQEEVAMVYEMMHLNEEALIHYDEIDALMSQLVENVKTSGFEQYLNWEFAFDRGGGIYNVACNITRIQIVYIEFSSLFSIVLLGNAFIGDFI